MHLNRDELVFWLNIVGIACWAICFSWMYRISATQHRLLTKLQEQAKRIETLSKEEHDLIKEVHPQVSDINADVKEVVADVRRRPDNRLRETPS